jgi:AraC-like DNA-binding protein
MGLLPEGCSVKEAAVCLGYKDPANFSRAFRRYAGSSPGQFAMTRGKQLRGSTQGKCRLLTWNVAF